MQDEESNLDSGDRIVKTVSQRYRDLKQKGKRKKGCVFGVYVT